MASGPPTRTFARRKPGDSGVVRGGDLPAGLKPSGEMSSFEPNFREKTVDAVRRARGFSDDREGYRKAEKVVDVLELGPVGAATALDDFREDIKRARGTGDYTGLIGTAVLGALPGKRIPVFKKNQGFKKLQAPKAETRVSKEPAQSTVKVKKESEVEIIPPPQKTKATASVKASGPKTRKPVSGGTSYSASSLEKTRTRPRTEKEANKFGPLARRKENLPVPRKENLPAVVREENRGIVPYKRPGELARYEDRSRQVRTFGDTAAKVDKGRIVGLSRMGKVAVGGAGAGLGALGYALSPDAKKAGAGGSSASGESRVYGGARPGEKTMGYGGRSATSGGKEDMQKRPEERKPVKAAGDKSRVAKKMTNFERMKQRQYEKEGVGGRSVTAEGARKRVVEERKYKPLAGLKSASLRSGSSGNSNRSKLAAAFRKKMQGRAK